MNTYEVNGKEYHLHYSIGRLEQIEKATGTEVMTEIVNLQKNRALSISVLKAYFAYGLMDDSGMFAPVRTALEFAQSHMQEVGYSAMASELVEQLVEDCGFLFREG